MRSFYLFLLFIALMLLPPLAYTQSKMNGKQVKKRNFSVLDLAQSPQNVMLPSILPFKTRLKKARCLRNDRCLRNSYFFRKGDFKKKTSPLFLAKYQQCERDSLTKRTILLPYFQLYSMTGQKHFKRKRWDLWVDGGPYLSSLLGETVVSYWKDFEYRMSAATPSPTTIEESSTPTNSPSFGQFLKKIIAKKSIMGVQDEFDVRYDHNIRYLRSQHSYISLKNNTILFLIGFRLALGRKK